MLIRGYSVLVLFETCSPTIAALAPLCSIFSTYVHRRSNANNDASNYFERRNAKKKITFGRSPASPLSLFPSYGDYATYFSLNDTTNLLQPFIIINFQN